MAELISETRSWSRNPKVLKSDPNDYPKKHLFHGLSICSIEWKRGFALK